MFPMLFQKDSTRLARARDMLSTRPLFSRFLRAELPFRVIVSSENTAYMAWQTQLFCFSALSRLGQYPTVIVHDRSGVLRSEFGLLQKRGFQVIQAPSYKAHPVGEYEPRNELGSLIVAASMVAIGSAHILFCEPDMLFVDRLHCTHQLTGEYYSYLDYEQQRIKNLASKIGLEAATRILNRTSKIGVPYFLPVRHIARIASRWIKVLDSFETLDWIDIMYAFGFALALEGLVPKTTCIADYNVCSTKKLSRTLIHYCYGDSAWNKRAFEARNPLELPDGLLPKTAPGTILNEIVRQIREARDYFADGRE